MIYLIAFLFVMLGASAPLLLGNKMTNTWFRWFIRRLLPALCYGKAIGMVLVELLK